MPTGMSEDSRRFYGVMSGTVDSLADPLQQGRVTVKFSWMGKNIVSNWARVATPMAGNDRGVFFMPKENDEVLIAFEDGNFKRPYVIGALWNKVSKSPLTIAKDGKNDVRLMKSYSGHTLTFDDTPNTEKVQLVSKSGHTILLDDQSNDGSLMLGSKAGHSITMTDRSGSEKVVITSKAGHTITLADASGAETITIQAKGGKHRIVLESNGAITIKSGQDLKIEAAGSVLINKGTKGAARLDDEVKSTAVEDSDFWGWVNTISNLLTTHTHFDSLGGPVQPCAITVKAPSACTGKVTKSSDKVKIG